MTMTIATTKTPYKTTCCYCGVGCGMLVDQDAEGRLQVRGDPAHPVNRGMLCSKGLNLHYTAMDESDRLLYPMGRADLEQPFRRLGWEEAIGQAAARFTDIINRHGPDAVGFYISGQCLTEEYYLANKLVKGFIGTNNIDTNSRLCMSSAVTAYKMALGEDSVPGCYEDLELADTILIAGANPAWCHPILYRRIEAHKARHPDIRVIVVDPRRTQTAASADLHLQINPGTDIVLYHAIARGLMEHGFIDEAFIRDHTEGFEALRARVMERSLQEAAAICGIRFTDIYKAVKYIGFSGGFISLWAMGLNQSMAGVRKNLALINLSLITGKIGRPGSGPFSLTGQANAMGGREVGGMANLLPAHRDLADPRQREAVARYWKVPSLPARPGLTATEMIQALADGRMKALWIACTNPLVSLPDASGVEAALRRAEFIVVQDMSARADTLSLAHLVLPAATWLEKEGTMTNSERRISHLPRVKTPPGEALPDAEILIRFARAMGWGTHFSYKEPSEIYAEHAGLTRHTRIDVSALDYGRLQGSGGLQWPVTAAAPQGTPRLFTDHRFYRPGGRARIHAVEDSNPSEPPDRRFPLILTTGRIRDQWHTMTRSGKVNALSQHQPRPVCELHPADAAKRDIREGDPVRVSHARGEVLVTARISDQIKKGVVFLPMHWGRQAEKPFARANNLTVMRVDPLSKQPDFKYTAVEVSRYRKPAEKLLVAGDSAAAAEWIRRYRALHTEDSITWLCGAAKRCASPAEALRLLEDPDAAWPEPLSAAEAEQLGIVLLSGRQPLSLDPEKKTLVDDGGASHTYDRLILAPAPALPATAGICHWWEADALAQWGRSLRPGDILAVLGGDPAAFEAAALLAAKGMEVHLLMEQWPEGLLDRRGWALVTAALEAAGIHGHGSGEVRLQEEQGCHALHLPDGATLPCRAVLSFATPAPDLALARQAGLQTQQGILVDAFLQTSVACIYALGEAAQHGAQLPAAGSAARQAESLARCLYGDLSAYYRDLPAPHRWRIGDWSCAVAGRIPTGPEEQQDAVEFLDARLGHYRKCFIEGDRLTGLIVLGPQEGLEAYLALMEAGTELGELRAALLRPGAMSSRSGAMVCSCRQVGEDNIIAAIAAGCHSLAELGERTGAGTRCGSCKPELNELLKKHLRP